MPKILIADTKQEISSFNPLPSQFENFRREHGVEMLEHRGRNTEIGGALGVFDRRGDIEIIPTIGARASSAGPLSREGWHKLRAEIVDAIAAKIDQADAVYYSMHGAMGADGELDPEGELLAETRRLAGPDKPIVISLDLHGILTEKMLAQIDGLTLYHTYPHVDFADTGARAAELLLRILDEGLRPVFSRVVIPALVRGDELITRTGCFGDLIQECRRLERDGTLLAGGIMIGNPFTDVPELCSQVVLCHQGGEALVEAEALRLAREFWAGRHRMQGKLITLDRAIAQARHVDGPVVFKDAADATSSGASGDSNVILAALLEAGYPGRILVQCVAPEAAEAAHRAGIGADIRVRLGGTHDPRFTPLELSATVDLLSSGRFRQETTGMPSNAGPSAVLLAGNATIVVLSKSVSLHDRAAYFAHGRDPKDYDLIVVKSPHTDFPMYDAWVERSFNIDAPGSTSANLPTLGHTVCKRPIFPLEPEIDFEPEARLHRRR